MMEWIKCKLSDAAFLMSGFPFKGENYSSEGIRVVRGDNITIGNLRWDADKDKRWNLFFDKAEEYSLKNDDIVIGMDGSRVGRNRAIIHESDLPLLLAQRVACIRNRENSIQGFLYYQIFSNKFEQYVKAVQTGTSIPHISLKQIGDFPIVLPPIDKQKHITNILRSLDAKIENNNKINANLEAQAQALFKSWFVDFEPFQNGEFEDSELGRIPKGWKVGTLKDIAIINPTLKLSKSQDATYLDMKNMPTSGSFPNKWEIKPYNGGMKFQNGDTLMARITPCLENGKVAYVNFLKEDEVGFGSTEYIVIRPKNGIFPELFYFLCRYNDFVGYATKNMNGSSGRQRVSAETIGNYKMIIPPINILLELAPLFSSIMNIIRVNGFKNIYLSTLRDTLLPKLMSGEIEV